MKLRAIFSISLLLVLFTFAASAQVLKGSHYLALGDSVAFGYIDQAGFEYLNPTNFVPYADYEAPCCD